MKRGGMEEKDGWCDGRDRRWYLLADDGYCGGRSLAMGGAVVLIAGDARNVTPPPPAFTLTLHLSLSLESREHFSRMADEEKEKLDLSLKDDDNENDSSRTREIPTDDIPAKVNMEATAVKSESSKLLNDDNENNSSSPSEIPMDDIPVKVKMAVKSELTKLMNDDQNYNSSSSSEIPILDDTSSKLKLRLSDAEKKDNANEKPMLEMDDIPAKVKMAAAAKSAMPDRIPSKTKNPRYFGQLSATVVSESRLLGEPHNGSSSDDETGNVSDE
ncbi:hypothetical protein L6452_20453 [Arctium lappa]|uniref:Uncharacterized protein n=1 Tax=Arctium lappa TaxID=4217 RepID=A0ACB9BCP3_ARCLA|nr:hypothetical protein L6452_20453 [Arctium lappa]